MSDSKSDARHAARLGAVQALYQMEIAGGGAQEVAREFAEHRFGELPAPPDGEFFVSVVNGALDTIARRKRAKEFGLPVPEGELDF